MDLEKRVMVIGSGVLFPNDSDLFNGFKPVASCDYRKIIEIEGKFVEQSKIGPDDKKIFSYIIFINVNSKEAYAFSRGEDNKKISVCIEGPVYSSDAKGDMRYAGFSKVLKAGALREINKQVKVEATLDDCHGFVNLEDQNYKARFGLLYFALTKSQGIRTQSRRTRVLPIGFAGKKSVLELESLRSEGELDSISKALLEPLKEYFNFL